MCMCVCVKSVCTRVRERESVCERERERGRGGGVFVRDLEIRNCCAISCMTNHMTRSHATLPQHNLDKTHIEIVCTHTHIHTHSHH